MSRVAHEAATRAGEVSPYEAWYLGAEDDGDDDFGCYACAGYICAHTCDFYDLQAEARRRDQQAALRSAIAIWNLLGWISRAGR